MSWADEHGLAARLARSDDKPDRLPLVLCGPILRRAEPDSVTVWVALKEPRTVTLRVYSHAPPPALESLREELQGTRRTVRLGEHLHVAAITARPVAADRPLAAGTVYFYNLFFSQTEVTVVPETASHLNSPNIVNLEGVSSPDDIEPTILSYSLEHRLPSFALPPEDLNKLRIIHGTCRKPDGPGLDALPALDEMIDNAWPVADERPHLLVLNGDQIYADDVAHTLLFLLMDADKSLLGWSETLPGVQGDLLTKLEPGKRKPIVLGTAWFTTDDPESHLLRFGEYCAMYLFNWSEVLWPAQFPEFADVKNDEIKRSAYDKERSSQLEFRKTLPYARRALANVPSYMMFDDHDVTDDWNMLRFWCENAYKRLLGRRVLQNALLAYAVFQAWGNTPERFSAGQPGEALLTAAAAWSHANGTDSNQEQEIQEQEIARLVGIPGVSSADFQVTGLFMNTDGFDYLARADDALQWHYTIKGPKFEILMTDTRTRRAFTQDKYAAPAHLGPAALEEQIPLDDLDPDKLFLVVFTTNVLTVPIFHDRKVFGDKVIFAWWYIASFIIRSILLPIARFLGFAPEFTLYSPDLKDSWKAQTRPFESLLSRLARHTRVKNGKRTARVLMLSGDVHFSWAARMQYWADRPFEAADSASQPVEAIFAHLTSSALKKEEDYGDKFHRWGYIPMTDSLPEPIRWFGWKEPTAIGLSSRDLSDMANWKYVEPWMYHHTPPMLALIDVQGLIPIPDWRYRIDFTLGEKSGIDFSLGLLEKPNPSDHENWLRVINEAHSRHRAYARKWGDGIEMVGKNNIAELRFQWEGETALVSGIVATDNSFRVAAPDLLPAPPLLVKIDSEIIEIGALDRGTGTCSKVRRGQRGTQAASHAAGKAVEVFKTVTQTHWWRLTGETRLVPLTRYTLSLSYDDPQFPKP